MVEDHWWLYAPLTRYEGDGEVVTSPALRCFLLKIGVKIVQSTCVSSESRCPTEERDKISRSINNKIFCACFYGVFALFLLSIVIFFLIFFLITLLIALAFIKSKRDILISYFRILSGR